MKNRPTSPLFFSLTYEFLEVHMPGRLGRSPATIRSYRDALTVFRRYLHDERKISISKFLMADCTRECLSAFVEYLKEQGCSAGTCNQRLAALKSYLWFVADKDMAMQSIALDVSKTPPCKDRKKEREILSDDALSAILRQPPDTKTGIRNRTIMILLYDSAIRLNELLTLKLGDINTSSKEPYIRVCGKGNKERIVAVSEKTAAHLENYISIYHAEYKKEALLFYTTIKGITGKMSPGNVERFIQQYADKVRESDIPIPVKVYPHMFRRTRATNLYQHGVELELVSQILGHSMTETTRIYARPSLEQMRAALESVSISDRADELPLWENDSEEEMARLCGLR